MSYPRPAPLVLPAAPGLGGSSKGCALCGPFLNIKPLIDAPDGRYINPLFDSVKVYDLALEPFPVSLAAGQTIDAAMTAQAEENHFGDFLGSEMFMSLNPTTGRVAVTIKSQQNDRVFMNAPVIDRFVFSNSFLRDNWPACFLIQATNFLQFRLQNMDNNNPVDVSVTASGRRFLPYQNPSLRDQLLAYWNAQRSIPFFLTFDASFEGGVSELGGGVTIAPGTTVTLLMSVPGAGDFEAAELMALVEDPVTLATIDANTITARISEGVGRALMSRPLPLGSHLAQTTVFVPTFQDGVFRSASGGHAKRFSQFFKRNSRIRVELTNTGGTNARVFLAYRGVMHYYDECPPGRGMNYIRSLEPVVSPMLVQPQRCAPVHAFNPEPGAGLAPTDQNPAPLLPATGYTPPVAMPATGQQVSVPIHPITGQPMNGMGGVHSMFADGGN